MLASLTGMVRSVRESIGRGIKGKVMQKVTDLLRGKLFATAEEVSVSDSFSRISIATLKPELVNERLARAGSPLWLRSCTVRSLTVDRDQGVRIILDGVRADFVLRSIAEEQPVVATPDVPKRYDPMLSEHSRVGEQEVAPPGPRDSDDIMEILHEVWCECSLQITSLTVSVEHSTGATLGLDLHDLAVTHTDLGRAFAHRRDVSCRAGLRLWFKAAEQAPADVVAIVRSVRLAADLGEHDRRVDNEATVGPINVVVQPHQLAGLKAIAGGIRKRSQGDDQNTPKPPSGVAVRTNCRFEHFCFAYKAGDSPLSPSAKRVVLQKPDTDGVVTSFSAELGCLTVVESSSERIEIGTRIYAVCGCKLTSPEEFSRMCEQLQELTLQVAPAISEVTSPALLVQVGVLGTRDAARVVKCPATQAQPSLIAVGPVRMRSSLRELAEAGAMLLRLRAQESGTAGAAEAAGAEDCGSLGAAATDSLPADPHALACVNATDMFSCEELSQSDVYTVQGCRELVTVCSVDTPATPTEYLGTPQTPIRAAERVPLPDVIFLVEGVDAELLVHSTGGEGRSARFVVHPLPAGSGQPPPATHRTAPTPGGPCNGLAGSEAGPSAIVLRSSAADGWTCDTGKLEFHVQPLERSEAAAPPPAVTVTGFSVTVGRDSAEPIGDGWPRELAEAHGESSRQVTVCARTLMVKLAAADWRCLAEAAAEVKAQLRSAQAEVRQQPAPPTGSPASTSVSFSLSGALAVTLTGAGEGDLRQEAKFNVGGNHSGKRSEAISLRVVKQPTALQAGLKMTAPRFVVSTDGASSRLLWVPRMKSGGHRAVEVFVRRSAEEPAHVSVTINDIIVRLPPDRSVVSWLSSFRQQPAAQTPPGDRPSGPPPIAASVVLSNVGVQMSFSGEEGTEALEYFGNVSWLRAVRQHGGAVACDLRSLHLLCAPGSGVAGEVEGMLSESQNYCGSLLGRSFEPGQYVVWRAGRAVPIESWKLAPGQRAQILSTHVSTDGGMALVLHNGERRCDSALRAEAFVLCDREGKPKAEGFRTVVELRGERRTGAKLLKAHYRGLDLSGSTAGLVVRGQPPAGSCRDIQASDLITRVEAGEQMVRVREPKGLEQVFGGGHQPQRSCDLIRPLSIRVALDGRRVSECCLKGAALSINVDKHFVSATRRMRQLLQPRQPSQDTQGRSADEPQAAEEHVRPTEWPSCLEGLQPSRELSLSFGFQVGVWDVDSCLVLASSQRDRLPVSGVELRVCDYVGGQRSVTVTADDMHAFLKSGAEEDMSVTKRRASAAEPHVSLKFFRSGNGCMLWLDVDPSDCKFSVSSGGEAARILGGVKSNERGGEPMSLLFQRLHVSPIHVHFPSLTGAALHLGGLDLWGAPVEDVVARYREAVKYAGIQAVPRILFGYVLSWLPDPQQYVALFQRATHRGGNNRLTF